MKVSKRCIRETIGEWRQMENGRRKRVKGGVWRMVDGGWELPYESNYNDWCCLLPFPLASFILRKWKTHPLSLCYTRVLQRHAKPCHNPWSSTNPGSIPLPHSCSSSIRLLCVFPSTSPSPSSLSIPPSASSFHSFVFITAASTRFVCDCCTCKMLAWCTAVYTRDD